MTKKGKDKYRQDGVNIEEGDDFSAFAGEICRQTYGISPFVKVHDMSAGNFRGPRGFSFIKVPKGCVETKAADGPGTKVVLIDAAGTYGRAAHEVFAMTASDISRWGGIPLVFASVLDTSTLGEKGSATNNAAREVIKSARSAAQESRIVILTGETAELGSCVGSENPDATFKFNWAGVMTGLYHPKKMILGQTLRQGQIIMALQEFGFRANGISSVRKALKIKYGDKWWANPEAKEDIIACAQPSVLYDRFLTNLNGWNEYPPYDPAIKMHLIVHLSGGAFESKLAGDILFPRGLSAVIDNLFEPPKIMQKCAKWRGMSEDESYKTWNGGQGMLVVIDGKDEKRFVEWAELSHHYAQKCGKIVKKSKPQVILESKFGSGKTIIFKPKPKTEK